MIQQNSIAKEDLLRTQRKEGKKVEKSIQQVMTYYDRDTPQETVRRWGRKIAIPSSTQSHFRRHPHHTTQDQIKRSNTGDKQRQKSQQIQLIQQLKQTVRSRQSHNSQGFYLGQVRSSSIEPRARGVFSQVKIQ